MTYLIMIGCALAGAGVVYFIDHFFLFDNYYRPNGELIFKKINEDEAKVEIKLYEQCLYDTVNAKKAVFKVVRE